MTPKQQAEQLIDTFKQIKFNESPRLNEIYAKECALITATRIILANPHSNPLHPLPFSTMDFWLEVRNEIAKS